MSIRNFDPKDVMKHIDRYEYYHKNVRKYLYSSKGNLTYLEKLISQAFLDRDLEKMDEYLVDFKELSSLEKFMDKKLLSTILTNYLISKLMLRVD